VAPPRDMGKSNVHAFRPKGAQYGSQGEHPWEKRQPPFVFLFRPVRAQYFIAALQAAGGIVGMFPSSPHALRGATIWLPFGQPATWWCNTVNRGITPEEIGDLRCSALKGQNRLARGIAPGCGEIQCSYIPPRKGKIFYRCPSGNGVEKYWGISCPHHAKRGATVWLPFRQHAPKGQNMIARGNTPAREGDLRAWFISP